MTTRRTVLGAALSTLFLADSTSAGTEETLKLDLGAYDKVPAVRYPWGWLRWLMNDEIDPKAELTLGLAYIEAHQSNPLHLHPNSVEIVHILSGSCEQRLGEKWMTLKAGDTLRIPRNTPHMARAGNQPMLAMIVYDTPKRVMVPVTEEKK
jgi:quercetin dioxygenase-like cupin family protein